MSQIKSHKILTHVDISWRCIPNPSRRLSQWFVDFLTRAKWMSKNLLTRNVTTNFTNLAKKSSKKLQRWLSRVKIDVLDEQKTKMTKITKNYQKTSRTVKIFAKNTELVIPNEGKMQKNCNKNCIKNWLQKTINHRWRPNICIQAKSRKHPLSGGNKIHSGI